METWLSVDCDFFFDSPADTVVAPSKRIAIPLDDLCARLPAVPEGGTLLGLDHHELLEVWDREGVRGVRCVHVDAHHDLFPDYNRAWELPLGARGDRVGVGDYLFHALREGVVDHLTWVCPPCLDPAAASREVEASLGSHLSRLVEVIPFARWSWTGDAISRCFLSLSPEWTPAAHLEAFTVLARSLGAPSYAIERWSRGARSRYGALAQGASPLSLRFCFPAPATGVWG
ncbi:MAG: hypothetical protein Q8S73_40080 [Deltaproteobacteria bacterium]|nr:hypothetical protein [Myxococcales bacterium]MDP3220365.1 hypothetical protein [Deltaproteobacteria bacterium]